jgi:hypothetical protein
MPIAPNIAVYTDTKQSVCLAALVHVEPFGVRSLRMSGEGRLRLWRERERAAGNGWAGRIGEHPGQADPVLALQGNPMNPISSALAGVAANVPISSVSDRASRAGRTTLAAVQRLAFLERGQAIFSNALSDIITPALFRKHGAPRSQPCRNLPSHPCTSSPAWCCRSGAGFHKTIAASSGCRSNNGKRIVCRVIAASELSSLCTLEIDRVRSMSAVQAWPLLIDGSSLIALTEGLTLRRVRVMNPSRVELAGRGNGRMAEVHRPLLRAHLLEDAHVRADDHRRFCNPWKADGPLSVGRGRRPDLRGE